MKIMTEKMKMFFELIKKVLKQATIYTIIAMACLASFFMGFYYKKMTTNSNQKDIERTEIKKSEVNLAIDQFNNLMIIDKNTGNYIVYEDSIGKSILKIYAKTIVNSQNNPSN